MSLTPLQYETLRKPLNPTRVAKRSQGGKQLSYLESWDVRAHLIRTFGYCNFDIETVEQSWVGSREYQSSGDTPKPMVEVSWMAKVRLTVRDETGQRVCRYTETAVGSTSGPASMIGEHHDNAVKTAASDALKRCAINLGTQFGLSLYDDGSLRDVVRGRSSTRRRLPRLRCRYEQALRRPQPCAQRRDDVGTADATGPRRSPRS